VAGGARPDLDLEAEGLTDRPSWQTAGMVSVSWRRSVVLGLGLVIAAACGLAQPSATPATGTQGPSGASLASTSPTTAGPASSAHAGSVALAIREFAVPAGSHPHDVSPATDGGIWYTAQNAGKLGHLDPASGAIREIVLGPGSAPHGVITGPDGAPWITDGGQNAIVRVDPATDEVRVFPLPADRPGANLNTAAFDTSGLLWFTGQSGVYGRLDPVSGAIDVFADPEGRGPYGITATPGGEVWYASLAGSHIARVDRATGAATIVEPPTAGQGSRRVWSDTRGRIWVSEWDAGQVGVHDPAAGTWREWRLPGDGPMAYAVFVDDRDIVWLTDFGANSIVRFDPVGQSFESISLPSPNGSVRQLNGRPGEVWGAESGADKLIVVTGG
jgi:virginiamycin B lyase